jgi:hypothetical protein
LYRRTPFSRSPTISPQSLESLTPPAWRNRLLTSPGLPRWRNS